MPGPMIQMEGRLREAASFLFCGIAHRGPRNAAAERRAFWGRGCGVVQNCVLANNAHAKFARENEPQAMFERLQTTAGVAKQEGTERSPSRRVPDIIAGGWDWRVSFEGVKGMANEQNLIPLNKRPKSEQRAIQKKGTKASRERRAEIKTFREITKAVLPSIVDDEDIVEIARKYGIKGDVNLKLLTVLGIIKAAASGDVKAFDRIMELTGEQDNGENGMMEKLIKGLVQDG